MNTNFYSGDVMAPIIFLKRQIGRWL